MENYFDSGALAALMNAVRADENAPALSKAVEMALNDCAAYVRAVAESEATLRCASMYMDEAEYRTAAENADRARHTAHNAAISMVNVLCRMCASKGVAPVFTGDLSDRKQVAEFCMGITKAVFDSRRL